MRSRDSAQLLFSKYDMFSVLESQKRTVANGVENLAESSVLKTPHDSLVLELADQFRINVPQLNEAAITVSPPREVEIDVSGDFRRASYGRGPAYVKGIEVTFRVPYSGDEVLFQVQPTTFNLCPPRATVTHETLDISFRENEIDGERIRKQFDSQIADIKEWLKRQENDVTAFNGGLSESISRLLSARFDKLQRSRAAVSSIGFPVKA